MSKTDFFVKIPVLSPLFYGFLRFFFFLKTSGNFLLLISIMHQGYSLCYRKLPLNFISKSYIHKHTHKKHFKSIHSSEWWSNITRTMMANWFCLTVNLIILLRRKRINIPVIFKRNWKNNYGAIRIFLGDTSFWKNQLCLFSIVNVLMSVIS